MAAARTHLVQERALVSHFWTRLSGPHTQAKYLGSICHTYHHGVGKLCLASVLIVRMRSVTCLVPNARQSVNTSESGE